jgi:hypothetical protein
MNLLTSPRPDAGNAFRVTPKDPSEAEAALISSAQSRPQAAEYNPQKTPSGDIPHRAGFLPGLASDLDLLQGLFVLRFSFGRLK